MGVWRTCAWHILGDQGGQLEAYGQGWSLAVGGSERQECVWGGDCFPVFLELGAQVNPCCVYSEL